jgi:hypothetical protein
MSEIEVKIRDDKAMLYTPYIAVEVLRTGRV